MVSFLAQFVFFCAHFCLHSRQLLVQLDNFLLETLSVVGRHMFRFLLAGSKLISQFLVAPCQRFQTGLILSIHSLQTVFQALLMQFFKFLDHTVVLILLLGEEHLLVKITGLFGCFCQRFCFTSGSLDCASLLRALLLHLFELPLEVLYLQR